MNDQTSNDNVQAAARRLRAAFVTKHPDESEIRNAVCAFVDAVKPLGWSIERVVVEVKRVAEVEDGFLFQARRARGTEMLGAERMLERTVTWCIEHYFWTPGARS
jgi:hypothetical protein